VHRIKKSVHTSYSSPRGLPPGQGRNSHRQPKVIGASKPSRNNLVLFKILTVLLMMVLVFSTLNLLGFIALTQGGSISVQFGNNRIHIQSDLSLSLREQHYWP
jgi:hypothetical protein